MNKDKTEGLWIGKLKHCKDKVGELNGQTKLETLLYFYYFEFSVP
jgi:hypothetical protein